MMCRVVLGGLLLLAVGAAAEIRCTQGTVGSTCPDEAPVCCFIQGRFTLGCCRVDEVCKPNGCAPAPPINTSWTGLTDSKVTIHFTGWQVATFVLVALAVLGGIFFLVCTGATASKRFAEFAARKAEERRRAAEPNSDDDAVDSDDERAFRKELQESKSEQRPTLASSDETTTTAALTVNAVSEKTKKDLRQENNGDDEEEDDSQEKDGLLSSLRKEETKTTTVVSVSTPRVSEVGSVGASAVGTCCLCNDALVSCVFMDCHHSVVCSSCSKRIKYCPDCKKKIRRRKHIFV